MGPWSDYPDEMDRPTPEQIEAILAAREGEDATDAGVSRLIRELREELLAEIPPEVMERHLSAMTAARAVSPATRTTRRKAMTPNTRRRTTLLSLAATLLLGMGVAAAVTFPDQALDNRVSGDLPIPGPTGSTPPPTDPAGEANDHGEAVSDVAHDDSLHGCEKGMAVSDVASSKADEHRANDPDPDPCDHGQGGGQGAKGVGHGAGGLGGGGGPPPGKGPGSGGPPGGGPNKGGGGPPEGVPGGPSKGSGG
jgi:hypothetical protein